MRSLKHAKASLSTVAALCALAALALAPAPAAATVNVDRCQPTGIPNVGTNSQGFCSLETSGSGSTGEPIIGEAIRVFGFLPQAPQPLPKPPSSDPVVECLLKNAMRCMPTRLGARDLDVNEGDAPSRGEPRGGKGSAGTGRKSETAKKAKEPEKPTKEECERYWKDAKAGEPMPQFKDRWDRLHAQWDKLNLWTRGRDQILEAFRVGQIEPLLQDIEKLRAQRNPVMNSAKLLSLEASHREATFMYNKLLHEARREHAARLKALRETQSRLQDEEDAILHPLLLSCKARKLI